MFRRVLALAAIVVVMTIPIVFPASTFARTRVAKRAGIVILDAVETPVIWKDGDTFAVRAPPLGGRRESARIVGYNTLESYGPVHQWGEWRPEELLALAKEAADRAAAGTWHCTRLGERDRYGRSKVACPDLSRALIESGFAHVFAMENEPPPRDLVAVQRDAQSRRIGIWRKGIPASIVTSIHSADEEESTRSTNSTRSTLPTTSPPTSSHTPYNRICDARTGEARVVEHHDTYQPCARWCHGGSCMTYVPFERRYRGKPWCLWQQPRPSNTNSGAGDISDGG